MFTLCSQVIWSLMEPKSCMFFLNNLSWLSCNTVMYIWCRDIIADIHMSVERVNSWDLKAVAEVAKEGNSSLSQALRSFVPATDHDLWHIILTDFQKHFIVLVGGFQHFLHLIHLMWKHLLPFLSGDCCAFETEMIGTLWKSKLLLGLKKR